MAAARPTGSSGCTRTPVAPCSTSSGMAETCGGHHGDAGGHGFHKHVGDAVAIAVGRHFRSQSEAMGPAIVADDLRVRKGSQQPYPVLQVECLNHPVDRTFHFTAADMRKVEVDSRPIEDAQGFEQGVVAFLGHQTADGENLVGRPGT